MTSTQEQRGLLQDIHTNPDDDVPRLVYADTNRSLWDADLRAALGIPAKMRADQLVYERGFPLVLRHPTTDQVRALAELYTDNPQNLVLPRAIFVECDLGQVRYALSGTYLTEVRDLDVDDCLRHLSGMTGLRELGLSYTAVTDDDLRHLAGLTQLQSLILYHTRVTEEGLRDFLGTASVPAALRISSHHDRFSGTVGELQEQHGITVREPDPAAVGTPQNETAPPIRGRGAPHDR